MKQFNFEDVKIGDRLIADNGDVVTYAGFSGDIPFENKKFYCRRQRNVCDGCISHHKEEWFDYKGRIVNPPKEDPLFSTIYKIIGKYEENICLKNCKYGDKLRLKNGHIALFLGESRNFPACYDIAIIEGNFSNIFLVDPDGKYLKCISDSFGSDVVEILK